MTTSPIIVRRNGNQFIPNDYLELVLKTHSAAWSASFVSTEGDKKDLMVAKGDGDGLNVKLIQETMEACPLDDITFCFYASDKALNMDDINPYVLLKNGDDAQVVAFVSGEFPGFEKPTSSKSSEFFFAHEYLKPKLEGVSELVDGNLEKIVSFISKPNFKNDALNNAPSHAVITLMCADNTTISFAKAEDSAEYPWGWVSNNLGYAKAKPEAKKEGEDKPVKKGMFSGKSTVREKANVQQPTAPEPKPEKSDAVTATAESLKANALENYTVKKGVLPPEHLSRKERGKWYVNRIGYKPDKFDQGRGVPIDLYVNPKGEVMTLSDVKKLGMAAAKLPSRQLPPRTSGDTETEHIQHGQMDNAPPAGEVQKAELLPIISPKSRQKLEAFIKDAKSQKRIAENASIVEDPSHVQEIEKKFASLSTQMKYDDMTEFCKWSLEMFRDLTHAEINGKPNEMYNPEAAMVMLFTFRNMVAGNYAKAAKKVEEVTTTHIVANEELKPEKKTGGMFAKRKVA
jgi:hypothetical protein